MPTIGQLKFGFGDRELALAFADLARDDFLPFVFLREEDALDDGFCFPAMGRVYVSLSLAITQGVIAAGAGLRPPTHHRATLQKTPDAQICTLRRSVRLASCA